MGKENRRSKKGFIITEILLVLLIAACAAGYYWLDGKTTEQASEKATLVQRSEVIKAEVAGKEKTLSELKAKIEKGKDIDVKIDAAKADYYNSIIELENRIADGKSDSKIAYITFDDGPYYNTYKVMDILDEYEHELVNTKIMPLIPESWHEEFRFLTFEPFEDKDDPKYGKVNGRCIKLCDVMGAYLEANVSRRIGIHSTKLKEGEDSLRQRLLRDGGPINASDLIRRFDEMEI